MNRAASVANSALTRGKAQMKMSDVDKLTWLISYLDNYKLSSEDLGSEFSYSLLYRSVDRIVFDLGVAQGQLSGVYGEHDTGTEMEARRELVEKILTTKAGKKYLLQVEAMIASILAERHEIKTRNASNKAGNIDLGLDDDET